MFNDVDIKTYLDNNYLWHKDIPKTIDVERCRVYGKVYLGSMSDEEVLIRWNEELQLMHLKSGIISVFSWGSIIFHGPILINEGSGEKRAMSYLEMKEEQI